MRRSTSFYCFCATIFLTCLNVAAQNDTAVPHSSINAPFRPESLPQGAPKRTIHERFATFRAGDFNSVLLLQNFRSDATVTITPLLVLQSGELALDPVTLVPNSAQTVDITAFLRAQGLADTFGTAVMRYTFSPYDGVSGVVLSSDEVHHLYVNSYAQSPEEYWQGTSYDAALWAPDEDTKGTISIINTSNEARTVHLTFLVKGHIEEQPTLTIPARHTETLNINDLVSRSRETGAGIHVEYSEYPGAILVEGHLVNQKNGFEKYIHFLDKALRYPNGAVRTQFLLVGQQPTEDGFPSGISFRSVAVVRNIDPVPVHVTPTLKYQMNGSPRSVTLNPLNLDVGETRVIDLSKAEKAGLIPADFHQGSLKLDPNTDHASIVAELFDFNDQTGGFTIGPMFFAYPGRATQSIWRTDGNFQTTIMVENTAAQDDAVTVQLFSDGGTFTKTLPIPAGNLLKLNLKQWQQEKVLDDNGNPVTDTYGVISLAGKNGHLSKLSFDKLIHSTVDSDYVGLPGGPGSCVGVTDVFLFLSGGPSPYSVWEEEDWSDGTIEDFPASGTGSSNTSALQIYSTSGGDMANVFPWGTTSHTIAFSGPVTSRMDCPACSVDDYIPVGVVNVPPMPTLSCTPATLTRGQSTTCTVAVTSGAASSSGWQFTDGTNTVSSGSTANSWSGIIVASGTVSVNVSVTGTAAVPLTASLTAAPRSGFAFSAVSGAKVPNNTYNCPSKGVINLPSPPFNGGKLGEFCLNQQLFINPAQISDSGPNKGYWYVTSALNAAQSNGGTPTQFVYVISPDLDNSTSTFSRAQCGNYNEQTNPNGFISWTNLFNNTVRHESGTVQSHYQNYVVAQNLSTNNVGIAVEAAIGPPGISSQTFTSNVFSTASSKGSTISTAAEVEPCGSLSVNLDSTCTFNGAINFAPYVSCQ